MRCPALPNPILFVASAVCLFLSLGLAQADISSGLLVHFPLTETSGSTVGELVGNKNGTLGSAAWSDPGIHLNGSNYVSAPPPDTQITTTFTFGCWVKLDEYRYRAGIYELSRDQRLFLFQCGIRLDDGAGRFVYYNSFAADNFQGYEERSLGSNGIIPLNTWTHIGVTYDGATWRSYINGEQDNEAVVTLKFDPAHTQTIGGRYFVQGMKGAIQDVRLYDRALSAAEMKELAPFRLDPALAGLWVGSAELNEAKEVASNNWAAAPAAFPQTIILHVNGSGVGHLIQEATVMKTREVTPEIVVVSEPNLIPNYDGIVSRGGTLIGQRFSSSSVALQGGKASLNRDQDWMAVTVDLPAAHPLNPFRHKYHPDLAVGRSIQRTIRIQFVDGDSPGDHTLVGTLWESIDGIHKDTIEARGPVTFTRVSTSGILR